jgi:hypothetical protein
MFIFNNPGMTRNLLILLCGVLFFAACKSGGSRYSSEFDIPDSLAQGELEVSEQAMENIVQNISSPVEMAALIKSLGVPYSNKYLASTKNLVEYNTSFKRAYALGIYGADLGYLNMYNRASTVLDYISTIKSLADGINVGQFFDFNTLKRLATNQSNLDSLMYISVRSFNRMDNYLRENNRGNLSVLIVAGVWVEGLYLVTQVAKENPNRKLAENIGEQKNILTQLLIILKNFQKEPYIAELIEDLEAVRKEFDPVRITIEIGEPTSYEVNGMLTIVQNEKSVIHISDEVLSNIINKVEEIRNKRIY